MRYSTLAVALLGVFLGVAAQAPVMRHAAMHRQRLGKQAQHVKRQSPPPPSDFSWLNNATAPYFVNGLGLPEVSFDIGESYAGLLPIDDATDRELWFWFVPTTNPAAEDEILIWLNGGPGCSSLDGFFHENGPVVWLPGQYLPVKNTYAWSNLTNVVWIEQPVGTGYTRGTPNATSEADVAAQFLGFWRNFMDLFSLQGRKVYVTGESYAGMYVPYIADAMIQENDTDYFNVDGILIYDPSIGSDVITEEVPTMAFVDYHHQLMPFNDTFEAHIRNISASCGFDAFLENGLTFPPKGPLGPLPGTFPNSTLMDSCDIFSEVFEAIFELNPCFDIYQVGQLCPILWDTLGFPYSRYFLPEGFDQPYFNRTDVKQAIHAPLDADWAICSTFVNVSVFINDTDLSPPSGINGGPLQRVVEKTNNVVVGHGVLDMVLILNGTLLVLQNLTWNGAQGFSAPPVQPFYVPYHDDPEIGSVAGAGVMGSWVAERGMTFVSIQLAGHMVPQFAPSAGYRHLELLLGRIENLSEVSAFSTQPGYPQPDSPLGLGTGPLRE